jgi:hypothetical protein
MSFSPPAQIAASSVDPRANGSPVRAHDSGSDSDDVEDDGDIPLRTTITPPLGVEEEKRKRAAAAAPAVPPAPGPNVSPVRAHDSCSDSDDVEDDGDIPLKTTITPPLEMEEKKRKRAAAAAPTVPPWRSGGAAAVVEMLRQGSPSVRGKKARVSSSLQHAGGLGIGDAASALKLTAPTKLVEEVDCPELGCPELGMGWRCILKKRTGEKHVDKYYIGPDGTQYNSRVKASQRASEDVATWVQCDKCDKWRSMPTGWKCPAVSSSRTLSFECKQHPNRELASCEAPEEEFEGAWSYGADELDKRAASARAQAEAEGLVLKPSPGAAAGASSTSTSSRFLHVQLVRSKSGEPFRAKVPLGASLPAQTLGHFPSADEAALAVARFQQLLDPTGVHAAKLVGTTIEVYWPMDALWYSAVVERVLSDGAVDVSYVSDGMSEALYLCSECWHRSCDAREDTKQRGGASGSGMGATKQPRCGVCVGCNATNCGKCKNCLDMPELGGTGNLRQACIERCMERRCVEISRTKAAKVVIDQLKTAADVHAQALLEGLELLRDNKPNSSSGYLNVSRHGKTSFKATVNMPMEEKSSEGKVVGKVKTLVRSELGSFRMAEQAALLAARWRAARLEVVRIAAAAALQTVEERELLQAAWEEARAAEARAAEARAAKAKARAEAEAKAKAKAEEAKAAEARAAEARAAKAAKAKAKADSSERSDKLLATLIEYLENCGGSAEMIAGWYIKTELRKEGATGRTCDSYFITPQVSGSAAPSCAQPSRAQPCRPKSSLTRRPTLPPPAQGKRFRSRAEVARYFNLEAAPGSTLPPPMRRHVPPLGIEKTDVHKPTSSNEDLARSVGFSAAAVQPVHPVQGPVQGQEGSGAAQPVQGLSARGAVMGAHLFGPMPRASAVSISDPPQPSQADPMVSAFDGREDMARIREVLTRMGLAIYADQFEDQGYDDFEYLIKMSEQGQLARVADDVNMKPGHKAKFVQRGFHAQC